MYTIKKIDSALRDWRWNGKDYQLVHYSPQTKRSVGVIQLVSVRDEYGVELYQQPWWLESRGEIDIIVTTEQKIVMIEVERHAVVPPQQYVDNWGTMPPLPFELAPGIAQIELPRGLSGALMQEAEEETDYVVEYVDTIGQVNANTAFFGTSPLIVVYKALKHGSGKRPETTERIKKVVLLTPQQVANLDTLCGFTKAALWEFCRWAFKFQPDNWWRGIAEQIVGEWIHSPKEDGFP